MGLGAGDAARAIREQVAPKVDWRDVLRRYLSAAAKSDYAWTPPNRRHIARGLYLPSLRSETLGPVVVAVDTSGSIDDGTLAAFAAEITAILDEAAPEAIHVVYCDAAVAGTERFEPGDAIRLTPQGGGGTAFRPVFDWIARSDIQPVCAIYLTDLDGDDFGPAPDYPVLWVSTGSTTRAVRRGDPLPIGRCRGARRREEEGCAGFRDGLGGRERGSRPARRGEPTWLSATPKITLSASRDIPFNKLLLSACNVRRIKAGVVHRANSPTTSPGARCCSPSPCGRCWTPTATRPGCIEIPAGGRRYRALELLVKQKRLAKTAPIPCVIRTDGIAEEDSLAENVQRAPLHPLDQFRAFLALAREGPVRGGDRRRVLRLGRGGEAAAAAGVGVAEAARRLRRGRHDAGPADGLHRLGRSRAAGAGLGAAAVLLQPRSRMSSAAC